MNTFLFKKMAIVLHTDLEKRDRGGGKNQVRLNMFFI